MVKVIMGLKGSGKTKQMIELVNSAVESEAGNVICIERGPKLTYDLNYRARLIEAGEYDMCCYKFLKGFISGLYAGNYDISHIFIDSLFKISGTDNMDECGDFLDWINNFGDKNNIKFTITISADIAAASDKIKSYC